MTHEWRLACQLAVAALLLFLVTSLTHYFYLRNTATKLTTQLNTLSQTLKLDGTLDDLAKSQITHELRWLTHLGKGSNFLTILSAVGTGLTQVHTVRIVQLSYQHERLVLRVQADNQAALNTWLANLRAHHLEVKVSGWAVAKGSSDITITSQGH